MKHVLSTALLVVLLAIGCSKSKPPVKPDPGGKPTGMVACELELALVCAAGTADGCLDGRTGFHACVADGETGGPPCEQEIAKVCPDGQVDACLATPPLATSHLCVVQAVAPVASACPAGESYYAPAGCGGGDDVLPLEAEGCYASCSDGAACAAGFECTEVLTDPCHDSACDACSGQSQLCIPSA